MKGAPVIQQMNVATTRVVLLEEKMKKTRGVEPEQGVKRPRKEDGVCICHGKCLVPTGDALQLV